MWRRDAALESCLDYSLGQRMFGRSFGGRCQREKLAIISIDRFQLADNRATFCERASLIEHDLRDESEALEGFACPHQNASLGSLAGTAHDRKRRGNSDGAGIAHDQYA